MNELKTQQKCVRTSSIYSTEKYHLLSPLVTSTHDIQFPLSDKRANSIFSFIPLQSDLKQKAKTCRWLHSAI